MYPEYALQIAAYARALEEIADGDQEVGECLIIRLDKKCADGYEVNKVHNVESAFKLFLHCLQLHRSPMRFFS